MIDDWLSALARVEWPDGEGQSQAGWPAGEQVCITSSLSTAVRQDFATPANYWNVYRLFFARQQFVIIDNTSQSFKFRWSLHWPFSVQKLNQYDVHLGKWHLSLVRLRIILVSSDVEMKMKPNPLYQLRLSKGNSASKADLKFCRENDHRINVQLSGMTFVLLITKLSGNQNV